MDGPFLILELMTFRDADSGAFLAVELRLFNSLVAFRGIQYSKYIFGF